MEQPPEPIFDQAGSSGRFHVPYVIVYFIYPSGLLLCQFHEWAHISSMLYLAFQPSSSFAFVLSEKSSSVSPARLGLNSYLIS